jgi:nucleotide-binding universal stress UspA family protein
MEGTIVCGVDGSAAAGAATRAAAELSARLGLRLVLVAVADPAGRPGDPEGIATGLSPRERARNVLDQLVAEHALGGRAERRQEVGDPAELLARVAAEECADLIVIGRRRARRFRKEAGPELAAELAAASPCPVVVVPEDLVRPAGTVGAGSSHSDV